MGLEADRDKVAFAKGFALRERSEAQTPTRYNIVTDAGAGCATMRIIRSVFGKRLRCHSQEEEDLHFSMSRITRGRIR